jgi:NAD dependent epimerase/dehydratase
MPLRVLITGAGGFIGSHLAERLVGEGFEVRAIVRYNSMGRRGWLDSSPAAGKMEILPGDIRDPFFVQQAMDGVDVVFHLAALIGIPYSYTAPDAYVQTNITGTLNVLQAARRHGNIRVVHTSTSEVYGTARIVPITEEHPLQGQSPYSATKIGADKLVESFHLSFDLPTVTVRPFNTFGPRQSARAVIPTIISQILAGNRTIRLGSTSPTRDLNFVSNTVDAFVLAGTRVGAVGQTIHFGSGREIAIGDLARLIAGLMQAEISIETDEARVRPAGSEVERLIADNRLAAQVLGWEPRVPLEEGLEKTIHWMRDNLSLYRAETYAV